MTLADPGFDDGYPLRGGPARKIHSTYLSRTERRRLAHVLGARRGRAGEPARVGSAEQLRRLEVEAVAAEFSAVSRALSAGAWPTMQARHVDAAWGILHRRIEVMPARIDRLLAAAMAAAVLVRAGHRVHLVADGQGMVEAARPWLAPLFQALDISLGVIEEGASEVARRGAWRCSATLVAAREVAMDFLRDAHNWPDRSDAAMRLVDGLMGRSSRAAGTLMRGLPCAVVLDADSTLVDSARTPIVLTRDAHPMHETEELKKALAMVEYLEEGRHYRLTGGGEEVELLQAGVAQLAAWAEQLDGLWRIEHVARQLLSLAIVVRVVLASDRHYRVAEGAVEWLVPEALVPGVSHYSAAFLRRMIEVAEELEASSQREVVGRASYQQVFNRYLQLGGLAHSVDGIAAELRSVYGLKCAGRGRAARQVRFPRALLLADRAAADPWLADWLAAPGDACRVVVTFGAKRMASLVEVMSARSASFTLVEDRGGDAAARLREALVPGGAVLAQASVFDHLHGDPEAVSCPLELVFAERSVRRCEDRRTVFGVLAAPLPWRGAQLLLCADDEVVGMPRWPLPLLRMAGRRLTAFVLESRLRQVQARRGREFQQVRRDLLHYDSGMQGLLSVSGRGLYD